MRTTLDLPDELFKHAKLAAVHEGVPLKVVIARALERGFALAPMAPMSPFERRRLFFRAPRESPFGNLDLGPGCLGRRLGGENSRETRGLQQPAQAKDSGGNSCAQAASLIAARF